MKKKGKMTNARDKYEFMKIFRESRELRERRKLLWSRGENKYILNVCAGMSSFRASLYLWDDEKWGQKSFWEFQRKEWCAQSSQSVPFKSSKIAFLSSRREPRDCSMMRMSSYIFISREIRKCFDAAARKIFQNWKRNK